MRLLICVAMLVFPLSAMAVYKCEQGKAGSGTKSVTYSDTPCQGGKSVVIDSSENTLSVVHETGDSRLAHQKEEARRLEQERHRREAQQDKEAMKFARANAAKKKTCARLAQKQKWREEDAAKAVGKNAERARLTARRAAEAYQLECG
ncbi:hypothetical protein EDC30_101591 [Paucimonas lemoignei]|uniref:DUF4124 domain-containing protein n=1 Tax=Paucimonas lemoignei TaxID=29443 RepID=A0A4R3I2Y8_PAULE|nr:DUF4124 domain-containing protein [Paucimonas lemoignei]TCS39634.1 hypothetical protein EDC30_101591 [Paucimonas lemoignei]